METAPKTPFLAAFPGIRFDAPLTHSLSKTSLELHCASSSTLRIRLFPKSNETFRTLAGQCAASATTPLSGTSLRLSSCSSSSVAGSARASAPTSLSRRRRRRRRAARCAASATSARGAESESDSKMGKAYHTSLYYIYIYYSYLFIYYYMAVMCVYKFIITLPENL